ncbi:MAG: hypothetical protein A4E57_04072 [Syntrophorhabdaceae bacterium PtaU1.Bin034]|nr:MAG: hypothetical protein A4E57_04072 [Syntrophorhabdaceae bacterium PtaU1.Bin034]
MPGFTPFVQVVKSQFNVADNNSEHVVEVVSNASGKSAYRLHFLRLGEPLSKVLLFLLHEFVLLKLRMKRLIGPAQFPCSFLYPPFEFVARLTERLFHTFLVRNVPDNCHCLCPETVIPAKWSRTDPHDNLLSIASIKADILIFHNLVIE